jgi:hypothetical protein
MSIREVLNTFADHEGFLIERNVRVASTDILAMKLAREFHPAISGKIRGLLPDFVNENEKTVIHRLAGVFVSGAAMVTRLLAQFAAIGDINAAPSPISRPTVRSFRPQVLVSPCGEKCLGD